VLVRCVEREEARVVVVILVAIEVAVVVTAIWRWGVVRERLRLHARETGVGEE
jgi:hypothetical protein